MQFLQVKKHRKAAAVKIGAQFPGGEEIGAQFSDTHLSPRAIPIESDEVEPGNESRRGP